MEQSVQLFSLSTCSHCKATKTLLNECAVSYDFTDVDLLTGKERTAILEDIKKRQNRFLRLGGQEPQHESLVLRIMDWVDVARQSIFPNVALDLPELMGKDS